MTFNEYLEMLMQTYEYDNICPFNGVKKCDHVNYTACYNCMVSISEYIHRYRCRDYDKI